MGDVVSEPAQTPTGIQPTGVQPAEIPPPLPGYVWTYPAPAPPPWRAPRWLVAATVIWMVVLVAGAVFYAFRGAPTVREQTTISSSRPVVDRAVADAVTAAGSGPVIAMSGFNRVRSCSITPVRPGLDYERTVTFYTAPGTEPALLSTIGEGMPARYRARVGTAAIGYLYADAGDYVAVTGTMTAPGQVLVRAITGCRPLGRPITAPTAPANVPPSVTDVLTALDVQASSTVETVVGCGTGRGVMRTVTAAVPPGRVSGPLGEALAKLSTSPVASGQSLFAYRAGATDVVVRQDASGMSVAATTRCG